MTTTSTEIKAPATTVYGVLSDPWTYPRWLTGTRRILAVDPDFPRAGTSFRHEVGAGPIRVRDVTTAVEHDPEHHRLVLRVRARPLLGAAVAELRARQVGTDRTEVVIDEEPRRLPLRRLVRPLAERMIHARNLRSLRRLRAVLEAGDAAVTPGAVPSGAAPAG